MEKLLHEIPPRQRLLEIEKRLKRVRSLKTLRFRVCEYLKCGGSEIKEFHHKINNHDWKGIIYRKRNNLLGTIFSLFDNKVLIIRGFPKIKYIHDSKVRDKECIAEEKIDGTNIGIWAFPDGSVMGKTRMVERWDLGSKRAGSEGSWKNKFEKVPGYTFVYSLAQEGYLVFCELYGYKNPGEFVKYSLPIAFKVIGIVDRKSYAFLFRDEVEVLCKKYNLPLPSIEYRGNLTRKEVEKIEFNLINKVTLDGMEGLVAKYWDPNDLDTYLSKLKCEKVKEKCWKISSGLIPSLIIRKAIKKARDENLGETQINTLLPIVIEELKEEYDQSLIEASEGKIKGLIRRAVTPSDKVLKARVLEAMQEVFALGVNIEDPKNKGKVLSSLHDRLEDINGRTLYKLYLEVLLEKKGKW